MRIERHKVAIQPGVDITSAWSIPENLVPGRNDAIILAHGAGNDMNHPFMSYFHEAFAQAGLLSVKFNFPYTEAGRNALESQSLAILEHATKGNPLPKSCINRSAMFDLLGSARASSEHRGLPTIFRITSKWWTEGGSP
jgi:hypothetical protein